MTTDTAGSSTTRPRRSLLGVPALSATARTAAVDSAADLLMFDLESSVEPARKAEARDQVAPFLATDGVRGPDGGRAVAVRVNAVDSVWFADDVRAVCAAGADALVLPETRTAGDLLVLDRAMTAAGAGADVAIWSMIETAEAVLDAATIVRATPRLALLSVGGNDLATALHAENVPGRAPLLTALSWTVVAARSESLHVVLDLLLKPVQVGFVPLTRCGFP